MSSMIILDEAAEVSDAAWRETMSAPTAERARLDIREVLAHLPHVGNFVGEDWFESSRGYPMYEKVGRLLKPKTILELGVLLGFGLIAFSRGAGAGVVGKVVGYDNEQDIEGSLELAAANVKKATGLELIRSRDLSRIAMHAPFDLIHVDADHTTEGTFAHVVWAWSLNPEAMLVDDYLSDKRVLSAVHRFADVAEVEFKVWDSYRGWAVFARDLASLPEEL